MELAFESSAIPYLHCAADTTAEQEETAEIIIPDSWPDAACVCSCFAEAMLRGKDCREGSLLISGGIKAGIFYQPETETAPRVLDCYLPFTVKIDQPELNAQSQVLCSCTIRSVDAKTVNSRKLRLRAEISCCVQAWNQQEDTLYTLKEHPGFLQVRTADYPLLLPVETGEKSFAVSDTPELPDGRPTISQICKCICTPLMTDQKLIGNKVVFKGFLRCAMIYADDTQHLYRWEAELPFSQYCELKGDYDEERVAVIPAVTGYDIQLDGEKRISITANLLVQCLVTAAQTISVAEDAYATRGVLQPEWKTYAFTPTIDEVRTALPVRMQAPTQLLQLLDWDLYADQAVITRESDGVLIKVPMRLLVTGFDTDGALRSETVQLAGEYRTALSQDSICRAHAVPLNVTISESGGSLLIDANTQLQSEFYAKQPLKTLCGGEIVPLESPNLPQLLIRTVEQNSLLWDIAKIYGSTVSSIQAANDLQGTVVPQTDLLLIPIGS